MKNTLHTHSHTLPHGFHSHGTHCVSYVSAEARRVIAAAAAANETVAVAAFDLDDTLVKTKSGGRFARSGDDWTWWHRSVPERVHAWSQQHRNGIVVVFTNQGGVTNNAPPAKPSLSLTKLLHRLHAVATGLSATTPVPLVIYAATRQSSADVKLRRGSPPEVHARFRKPGPGMWEHLVHEELHGVPLAEDVFYVGDAAGRPGDFADTDRAFAAAIGVPFFTPEEFFER